MVFEPLDDLDEGDRQQRHTMPNKLIQKYASNPQKQEEEFDEPLETFGKREEVEEKKIQTPKSQKKEDGPEKDDFKPSHTRSNTFSINQLRKKLNFPGQKSHKPTISQEMNFNSARSDEDKINPNQNSI
jgi:hypothetical protein